MAIPRFKVWFSRTFARYVHYKLCTCDKSCAKKGKCSSCRLAAPTCECFVKRKFTHCFLSQTQNRNDKINLNLFSNWHLYLCSLVGSALFLPFFFLPFYFLSFTPTSVLFVVMHFNSIVSKLFNNIFGRMHVKPMFSISCVCCVRVEKPTLVQKRNK